MYLLYVDKQRKKSKQKILLLEGSEVEKKNVVVIGREKREKGGTAIYVCTWMDLYMSWLSHVWFLHDGDRTTDQINCSRFTSNLTHTLYLTHSAPVDYSRQVYKQNIHSRLPFFCVCLNAPGFLHILSPITCFFN